MKRRVAAFLAVLLLLAASGCRRLPQQTPDSIIGTWKDVYGLTEYQFSSGGSMRIAALNLGSFKGTYQVSGNKISMRYRIVVKVVNETYSYRIDGDTLYLNDNKFTRKK